MKLNFKSRSWHKWTSLIIALPILIVTVTAVFMSHKKALGTDEIKVAAQWLPGYRLASGKSGRNEARASLLSASGETYVGTLGGLYRLDGEQLVAVAEVGDTQIRGLAEADWGRVAAARNGVWLQENGGKWQRVAKGDAWSAARRADGSIAVALRNEGLLVSHDGRRWQADAQITAALASLPDEAAEPVTLSKLAFDLHTGRAFLGKEGEWIWIDFVSLPLILLALTGVYMWWRAQRRKVTARRRPALHIKP